MLLGMSAPFIRCGKSLNSVVMMTTMVARSVKEAMVALVIGCAEAPLGGSQESGGHFLLLVCLAGIWLQLP
jgi:hypothetical protein